MGSLGFGQKISWEDDRSLKPGCHQLTFREALHTTTEDIVLNIALPWWMKAIPHPRLKRIRQATNELRVSKQFAVLFSDLLNAVDPYALGLYARNDQGSSIY